MEENISTTQPLNIEQPKVRKKGKLLFGLVLIIGFFLILGVYILQNNSAKTLSTDFKKIVSETKTETITVTPMPFVELTIPFLREKTYESKLSELNLLSDGSSYTSYLTYYTSDGLRVNGLLTKPNAPIPDGGFPAIVFVHGYLPPKSYVTDGQAYSAYVDYLSKEGFVVFKIDLRGHGASEGEAGGGYYGSDYVSDILHAYSALENAEFVNPKQIGLWGHSMAGNAVLRSLAVKPDIPGAVIWAGAVFTYTDMQKYRINDASYQPPVNNTERQQKRRELFEKHGSPSAESAFWMQVAPTNYLDDIKGAISLHHAVDDDVVNIGYSRDLNDLLDKTSVRHELFEYASGGHNISGASFNQAMQRTAEFYKTYLH